MIIKPNIDLTKEVNVNALIRYIIDRVKYYNGRITLLQDLLKKDLCIDNHPQYEHMIKQLMMFREDLIVIGHNIGLDFETVEED